MGEGTFYFLPQPILKEYVTEMEKLNGRYGIDKTKSNFTLRRDAVTALKNKYIENARVLAGDNKSKLSLLEELDNVDERSGLNKAGDPYVFTIKFLNDQLTSFKNKTNDFDYFYNQLLILNAYQELTPFAEELSELVHISQIDTKKFGNSFALQQRFLYRVRNMLSSTSAFDKEDLIRLFEDSFLDAKLRNSVIAGNELAKDMLITSTDAFNQEMESIMSKTNHSKTKDETFIKNVSNGIEAFVRSKFFTEYAADNAENPYMDTYNLFYNNPSAGTLSMANRFAKIKSDMINGKYPEFIDKEGRIVDDFINYLSAQPKTENDLWNIPDVIGRNVPIGTDKYLQDKLTSYWNELINNKQYPELAQFGKDLVYYAFVTSGGNTKLNSIFHLVPSDYLAEIGYHNSIKQSLEDLTNNSFDIDTDDIFKNNWWNGNLVPDITLDKGNSHIARVNSTIEIPGTHIKYPIVLFNHKANPIGINSDGETLFRPYIKANLDKSKNPNTTLLYKYIGNYNYVSNFGGKTEVSVKPVYVLVNKKGLSQEGVFIVEHDGYSNSAFGFNNIPSAVDFHTSDPTTGFMLDGSSAANVALVNSTNLRSTEKVKLMSTLNKIEYIKNFDIEDAAYTKTYDDIMLGEDNELSQEEQLDIARSVLLADDEAEGDIVTNKFRGNTGWARHSENSYEVSSAGDNRFSALSARLKDGRTIEEAYQLDVKGYRNLNYTWQQAKKDHGVNAPIKLNEEQLYNAYKELWQQWADENPELMQELRNNTVDKILTDKFATGLVTQARALSEILNETEGISMPIVDSEVRDTDIAKPQYYIGNITPDENTIFVFGSNPVGINGNPAKGTGGAALVASTQFGVKQGERMDNKLSDSGNAYGLTTVTYPGRKRSMSPEQITQGIKKLYETAKLNPDKQFKIAYRNTTEKSLNGYTGLEMIDMFNAAGEIPTNIVFSKEWFDTGLLDLAKVVATTEQEVALSLPVNGKEVVYNNQTFIVTPNGKVYGKDGKEKYTSTDKGTMLSKSAILNKAFFPSATLPTTITKKANPIITDNGIKISGENPNIININGRQIDIKQYGVPFKLNSDQITALTRIDDWYNNSDTISHTLIGAAGTGKTSITKVIVNSIASQHPRADIVLASFTHSAVKNLAKLTGREAITIHSMLGLSLNYDLDNFKLDDLNFEKVNDGHKFEENGIIVIDECSMVNENLVEALRDIAKENGVKILFIGDDKQLMPVGENRMSLSFRDEDGNMSRLTKVERQQGSNPLLKQLDAARASQEDPTKLGVSFSTDYDSYGNGVVTIPNKNPYMTNLLDTMVGLLKSEEAKTNPYIIRGLAFRNETVDAINRGVRIRMGYESKLEVGEPIKFYSGSDKFTNSAEARVSRVSEDKEADLFSICGFKSSKYPNGFMVKYNTVEVSDFDDATYNETFHMISDESYKNDLAQIYKDYHDLTVRTAAANPMYRGRIWREYYKNTGAIVTPYDLKVGRELVKKVVFKPAYASTVHKSQGSTYTNVMVHQEDINAASDPMLRKQLTYVAMSRPTRAAFVVTNSDLFHENAINEYNEEMNKANDEFDSDAMTKCKA